MKTTIVLLMAVCFLMMFQGCVFTGNQIKGDSEIAVIAEIAARRIGYHIAQNENVETIKKYIAQMNEMDDSQIQTLALAGMRYLADKYTGDPLLADDLMSIIKLLGIDLKAPRVDLDGGDIKTLKAVINAFGAGMGA